MFNSKYPIVCAPMNRVSDLKLALACAEAGIVPSLIPYPDFKLFLENLEEYKSTGKEIFVAIELNELINPVFHKIILNSCITHVELIDIRVDLLTEINIEKIQQLKAAGIKIFLKILGHDHVPAFSSVIDGVVIKGSEGAGRSRVDVDLVTEIKKIKELYPYLAVIASGGVKNKQDIDELLAAGACAVSIGTMFAMSAESSVPEVTKKALLEKTSADITRTQQGRSQRAIVFGAQQANDDENNTFGLITGLNTGTAGHIFIGNAITEIQDILPVDTIVKKLMGVSVSE
jgi:NAD(P)H-dependent flavin oxidoreductase YrpB (nitropropane dioxygenase family)